MLRKVKEQDESYERYRRSLKLAAEFPRALSVQIASTKEDLEQAYRLLHDAYVAEGYSDPQPSGLRITPFHALPSSTVVVAKWRGEVIGTVSLFRMGAFGLPLQSLFDLENLAFPPSTISEVSSLAVHPKFRFPDHRIVFALIKYSLNYSIRFFGCRCLVVAVNPKHQHFYRWLLGFRNMGRTKPSYGFVKNAPAVGQWCCLENMRSWLKKAYACRPNSQNFYKYVFETHAENFKYPSRTFYTISDPVMSPALLEYFFKSRTNLLQTFTPQQMLSLSRLYQHQDFRKVLPLVGNESEHTPAMRIDVDFPVLIRSGVTTTPAFIRDCSRSGIKLLLKPAPVSYEPFFVTAKVSASEVVEIKASLQRSNLPGTLGCKLTQTSNHWEHLVGRLEEIYWSEAKIKGEGTCQQKKAA